MDGADSTAGQGSGAIQTGEGAVRLRSFKLQRHERRVRVVPAVDLAGCPFGGPGVDLVGDESDGVMSLAAPLFSGIEVLEPGVRVRSVSVDLEKPRLLITLEATGRPRAIRIDEPSLAARLLAPCDGLLAALAAAAATALGARAGRTV